MTILRIDRQAFAHRLRLAGELDQQTAPDLVMALAQEVQDAVDLELDLEHLTFMDSAGLHVIIQAAKALSDRGMLVLTAPTPPVARLLELSGIVGLIPNLKVIEPQGRQEAAT